MGRHLRSAGLGSAGLSCPGRDVTLGCADTEHLCSAPHPPPATPSRQRTRPDVCLFSSVDFPALRAEAALRAGWEGSPALAGGISLPLPCCRRSGRSASRSARRLSLSPGVPGRGRRCPQPFPREPWGTTMTVRVSPRKQFLGRGVPRKRCKKLLGNHCHVKSWRVQEQLQDTSYIISVPLTAAFGCCVSHKFFRSLN